MIFISQDLPMQCVIEQDRDFLKRQLCCASIKSKANLHDQKNSKQTTSQNGINFLHIEK